MVLDWFTGLVLLGEVGAIALVSWYLKRHWQRINDDEFARAREAVAREESSGRRGRKGRRRRKTASRAEAARASAKDEGRGEAEGADREAAADGAVSSADAVPAETAASLGVTAPPRFDYEPLVAMGVVAVSLTLQQYFGHHDTYQRLFRSYAGAEYYPLGSFAWWSGWRVFGYVVLPAVAIVAMRRRIRDYGLQMRGQLKHLWIYVVLYLVVLPGVIIASFTQPFQHTYPFYKCAGRSAFDFIAWELLYAAQFVSLEFFFRGYILQALRRTMGAYAIFVMVVPYCMIHYGKPILETTGAIVAGLVLGTLAMRTGSIWCGALIHISVALTMDGLALYHTGFRSWPRCGM